MKNKIFHFMELDKFNVPFMDFVEENFDGVQHRFVFLHPPEYKHGMTPDKEAIWIDKKYKAVNLLQYMYKADKIIIHGLWSKHLIKLLFLQPWLLKKCYHVMWGGDFYFPEKQNWIKKQVIKKMGHFITCIKGDYELAKKWYGAKGKYHECFMYPSNLYKEYDIKLKEQSTINIQVGNSADPSNNHIEVFEKLRKYKGEDVKIFVPLSYGIQEYAKDVIEKGKEIYGDKFVALTNFMPFEKYLEFLGDIDIAIFAHDRQQAMGNVITLLGLGKKVYIKHNITPWKMFEELNIKLFDANINLSINILNESLKEQNQKNIKEYFSKENYLRQLNKLFES